MNYSAAVAHALHLIGLRCLQEKMFSGEDLSRFDDYLKSGSLKDQVTIMGLEDHIVNVVNRHDVNGGEICKAVSFSTAHLSREARYNLEKMISTGMYSVACEAPTGYFIKVPTTQSYSMDTCPIIDDQDVHIQLRSMIKWARSNNFGLIEIEADAVDSHSLDWWDDNTNTRHVKSMIIEVSHLSSETDPCDEDLDVAGFYFSSFYNDRIEFPVDVAINAIERAFHEQVAIKNLEDFEIKFFTVDGAEYIGAIAEDDVASRYKIGKIDINSIDHPVNHFKTWVGDRNE